MLRYSWFHRAWLLIAAMACAGLCASSAAAAGGPQIAASWVTEVSMNPSNPSAALRAQINPNELSTTYRFDYITEAAYQANVQASPPRDGFTGAAKVPPGSGPSIGSGTVPVSVLQRPAGLAPTTVYRYRAVAVNSAGTTPGPARRFETQEATPAFHLADNRGWEMVSPVDKGGGSIQGPGQIFGGGVFQAAPNGEALAYSSADSFGAGAQGAPAGSQYIARRGGAGWGTENITTPLLSGSYGATPNGVPYQLFSTNLDRGLLSNGERCRGQAGGSCPVANPPLPGSGAPGGYRDYYLRASGAGSFASLLGSAELNYTALGADQFELRFAGASPDLGHVVLSSCAALTSDATEVPSGGGCAAAETNLYEWSGSGLSLVNLLPGDTQGTTGAVIGAQAGAVSSDGNRVYFSELEDGALYLREGGATKLLPGTAGGGAAFQTASSDGRFAFFTKGGHLYRYDASSGIATDLTPPGEVLGVLGASDDGSTVYYQSSVGLFVWDDGAAAEIVSGSNAAAPSSFLSSTGTARVSADGSHLAFVSTSELTTYENQGVSEVYLYGLPSAGGEPEFACASCRPSGERPAGAGTIPGAVANGEGAGATRFYKPRALSADGTRVFFDSTDSLVLQDTDNRPDVYEWEASGAGSCAREVGCVNLVSSGRGAEASSFVDASSNGSDAFFLTEASLVPTDPGSYDVYDARENGGFPVPATPVPCQGDACQPLPLTPEDPTPGTLTPNRGNQPLRFPKSQGGKKKHHKKKHHKGKKHHKKKGAGR